MIRLKKYPFAVLTCILVAQLCQAQQPLPPKLIWKVNKVNLGTVLEEQGPQIAEFEFTHTQDSIFYIDKVWTDCGCTTVDYTRDTLRVGEGGVLQVSFDPASGYGEFSRMIVVKGNLAKTQDTLFIEGHSIPYPEDPESAYPIRRGDLGFRLQKVNMGEVLTNEPKIKQVEFYNFGKSPISKSSLQFVGPGFIQVAQLQEVIRPQERGLLNIVYDGVQRKDLGYFEDQLVVSWGADYLIRFNVVANVFEYFPPVPKDQLKVVPQLGLSTRVIDLKEIKAKAVQRENVLLSNKGEKTLEIRKIQGNCDCLTLEIPKTVLEPGESIPLTIAFDPAGRQGIDQRNIYIFSNDPVNSVQLLVLKSRVE